ncbi:MAG: dienelactone hydrolase family protein [Verrucomicrobia bacterium]|nr:dienelactone hydrolase family protein [Verrucomicrobiota bacterium]
MLIVDAEIPCKTVILCGTMVIPAGARGIVLFAHGSGSSRHSPRNQFVARHIHQSGNGTLLFDLLTPDEEIEDRDTGGLRFNITLLTSRLVDATQWVIGQPAAGKLGIGYFGSSTGGAAALSAAARVGQRISAVVSRGGRPDLAHESLAFVHSPTLLIIGQNDHEVVQLNEAAYAELRCEKELKLVPGATHLFEEPGTLQIVADWAARWFCRHLHTNA